MSSWPPAWTRFPPAQTTASSNGEPVDRFTTVATTRSSTASGRSPSRPTAVGRAEPAGPPPANHNTDTAAAGHTSASWEPSSRVALPVNMAKANNAR